MSDIIVTDKKQIKLVLLSSRSDLIDIFTKFAKQDGLNCRVIFAGVDEAGNEARKAEDSADVFLALPGTAEQIKEAVDIPVVTIPYTAFDVMRTVYSIKPITDKIALITYREKMYGIEDIQTMLGVKIFEYTIEPRQQLSEITTIIEDIKRHDIQAVIGGMKFVQLAKQHGLQGFLRYCGDEAVHRSIYEAIRLAKAQRMERSFSIRIKTAFDALAEGVIVTDEHNTAVIYNPAAEKIFKIPQNQVLGHALQTVFPTMNTNKVFNSGQPELNNLQEINSIHLASNRIPVFLGNTCIGVVTTFEDVTKIQQLEQLIRNKNHTKGFIAKNNFDDIVSTDSRIKELKELAILYAATDSSVIIYGQSGTGKELFAQSIHNSSKRAHGSFVAVNCAVLPEHLLESELFGYEGGAFTGARKEGKQGLFELAHNGTIFLDEIGEVPKSLQARLLRVLQEKEIMRIGGNKIIPVNIRIISATNINLETKVKQGEFREDLYYRLNVLNLELPPLKDRKQDILLLSTHFLKNLGIIVNEKNLQEIKPWLLNYEWPGNIRELCNIMERLSLLITNSYSNEPWDTMLKKIMKNPPALEEEINIKVKSGSTLKTIVNTLENKYIALLLAQYKHDYEAVAKKLGISRTTLWRKIKEI